MADEFIKGLGILTAAGLGWMTVSAWFNTPSFDGPQLIGPSPESLDMYGQAAVAMRDVLFWFAVLGALTFWVVIPALREGRRAYERRRSES